MIQIARFNHDKFRQINIFEVAHAAYLLVDRYLSDPFIVACTPIDAFYARTIVFAVRNVVTVLFFRRRSQIFNSVIELVFVNVVNPLRHIVKMIRPYQTMRHVQMTFDTDTPVTLFRNHSGFVANTFARTSDSPKKFAVTIVKQTAQKLFGRRWFGATHSTLSWAIAMSPVVITSRKV